MNQINFETQFDQRLDALLNSKLAALFGNGYAALKVIPTVDAHDGRTIFSDNGVLKLSSAT
ncbi:MAG: hypothetical protein ABFD91_02315 [Anaerohalosphaeraceae bacterium]